MPSSIPSSPSFSSPGPAPSSATGAGLSAVLPEEVVVTFPIVLCGRPPVEEDTNHHVETVALADLVSGGFTGRPGAKVFHDTAAAIYLDPDDLEPVNRDQLRALAVQIAADYLAWFHPSADLSFAGIAAWQPEAHSDLIVWEYAADRIATRVTGPPWNGQPEELLHETGATCASVPSSPSPPSSEPSPSSSIASPPSSQSSQPSVGIVKVTLVADVRCVDGRIEVWKKDEVYTTEGHFAGSGQYPGSLFDQAYFDHEAGCCDCPGDSGSVRE